MDLSGSGGSNKLEMAQTVVENFIGANLMSQSDFCIYEDHNLIGPGHEALFSCCSNINCTRSIKVRVLVNKERVLGRFMWLIH